MNFRYAILDAPVRYSGAELRSGWVAEQTGLGGDAAAGFTGPCFVATGDLVDLEDAAAGAHIESASMAHVIIEHPGCSLRDAVLRQRILACLLAEVLAGKGIEISRSGDDLYAGGRKLTVSIAAPSSDSCLIHMGINVDPAGAPVPAVGLGELGVDPANLLDDLLARYGAELAGCAHAETKVRTVP
ncbi:MAG: DUF366 family protein [Chitinivibrionia bacterium]|nr:DUF366 family protein [Chitinivibrionia bacterium]